MKKFITLFTILSFVIVLSSCEDGLTLKFDTNFRLEMTIDVEDVKSDTYLFANTEVLNVEDEEEIEEYLNRIKEIEVTEVECRLRRIPSGAEIKTLNISVEEVGINITLENITEDYTLILPITPELLDALSQYVYNNMTITVKVSGESSYAPMDFDVNFLFKSKVTASV